MKQIIKTLLALIFLSCLIFYYLGQCIEKQATPDQHTHSSNLFSFDKNVLIFVHVQKTGGSDFDRNIVKHLLLRTSNKWKKACDFILNKTKDSSTLTTTTTTTESSKIKLNFLNKKVKFKKYACHKNWYFSRQTFGWSCGLHPGYSDLKYCVKKFYPQIKNEFDFKFFTILREPLKRYLSEWQHVSRGATWKPKNRKNNKKCLINNYEKCFENRVNWQNVSLVEFMNCKFNLANNRQTKYLAYYDSNFEICSDKNDEDELLRRAKKTLKSKMTFFAINEFQYLSALLFEKTFNNLFKFEISLTQSNSTIADLFLNSIHVNILDRIKKINYLDVQLYEYGKKLFFERIEFYNISNF
jgi:hypothetical protein